MKKHNHILLKWIILASLITRLVTALLIGDTLTELPGIFDQISYHKLAVRVLEGFGFTFDQDWWPVTKAGQPTAHWSYLYTLYLAIVYYIFGIHPLAARLIQAVVAGIILPLLLYKISVRIFYKSPYLKWIGLVAAAWGGCYGYFVYYAGALMTETFYILALLWVLDTALRIAKSYESQPIYKLWLELGLALAVTVMLRQVFFVFIPFLFLWLFVARVPSANFLMALTGVLRGGIISAIIMIFLIAPITLHNYHKFNRFVLLNTNAGYAFFWANHPVHGDYFVPLFTEDMPSYQDLIPTELSNLNEAELESSLLKLGWGFISADPWRYLLLCLSRIPAHFIFWPLATSSFISNIVRVGSFGIALPFIVFGAFIYIKNYILHKSAIKSFAEPGILILLFIIVYTGVHLLAWAGIRYRLPTDSVSLLFAAYALMAIALRTKIGRLLHAPEIPINPPIY